MPDAIYSTGSEKKDWNRTLKFALTWLRGFKFLRLMTLPFSAKPEETVERMRQEVEGGGKKLTRDVYKKNWCVCNCTGIYSNLCCKEFKGQLSYSMHK